MRSPPQSGAVYCPILPCLPFALSYLVVFIVLFPCDAQPRVRIEQHFTIARELPLPNWPPQIELGHKLAAAVDITGTSRDLVDSAEAPPAWAAPRIA